MTSNQPFRQPKLRSIEAIKTITYALVGPLKNSFSISHTLPETCQEIYCQINVLQLSYWKRVLNKQVIGLYNIRNLWLIYSFCCCLAFRSYLGSRHQLQKLDIVAYYFGCLYTYISCKQGLKPIHLPKNSLMPKSLLSTSQQIVAQQLFSLLRILRTEMEVLI